MKKWLVIIPFIIPVLAIAFWVEPLTIICPQAQSPCRFFPIAVFREEAGIEEFAVLLCKITYLDDTTVVYQDSLDYTFAENETYIPEFSEANLDIDCYEIHFCTRDASGDTICDEPLTREFCCVAIEEQPEAPGLMMEAEPLSSALSVHYRLANHQSGYMTVYDCAGTILDRLWISGSGTVNFGGNLSSGVYFVHLSAGKEKIAAKVVIE